MGVLCHLLLEHLLFLLELLEAHVQVMQKDVLVDNLLLFEGMDSLLVSETASA